MSDAALLVEITRGGMVESRHRGHVAIVGPDGTLVDGQGDPSTLIYPRSSSKIVQALPLMESGAGAHLNSVQLALACASHSGEQRHIEHVARWLADLGLDEHALCCGPQASRDPDLAEKMIRTGEKPTRIHNWCSGKHAGFLTLTRHLGAGPDYVALDHPVQRAVKDAFEDLTGEVSPGHGIDGCSAPNFACSLTGLARAMARIANADGKSDARALAAVKLRDAMIAHPDMVAGKGRAGTELVAGATEPLALKSGAEGVYVAILPKRKLGIALKIEDGASRASEAAITSVLVGLGALDPKHPVVAERLERPIRNWDGLLVGTERPVIAKT